MGMRANLIAAVSLVIAILTVAGLGAFSAFFQTTTVTITTTETLRTTVTEEKLIPFTLTIYSISTVTKTEATTILNPTTITHTITSTETLPEAVVETVTATKTIYKTITSSITLTQTVTNTITTFTPITETVTSISPTTITSTATHFVTTTETMPTTYTITKTATQTVTSPTTITQTVTITSPTTVTRTVISNVTQIVFQTVTVFSYTTEAGERVVASVSNVSIPAYYSASFNVWIDAGKAVKLSWKADNNLYVYIMTESQFKSGWIILPSYYEAYKYGREGTISAYSCCGDRYYMVFINLNLANVKLYEAKVTVI